MFDHPILARQFDRVIVKIDPERRKWAPHVCPCPDGTEGVIIGFYEALSYTGRIGSRINEPGVYHRRGAAIVWLPDGQKYQTGTSELELVDREENDRRLAEFRALQKSDPNWHEKEYTRIGDLPELPFWEGDVVRDDHWGEVEINRIDYHQIGQKRNDKSPMPIYGVKLKDGGTSVCQNNEPQLVSRGNVWKYYHKEPLSFGGVEEEAAFYTWIGRTKDIKNPRTDNYAWTKDEVLAAIKRGDAHAFQVTSGLSRSLPFERAIRFIDEDVGERVRKATLEGFGIAA